MRLLPLSTLMILTAIAPMAATAADLPTNKSPPPPPLVAPVQGSGFYTGAFIGGAFNGLSTSPGGNSGSVGITTGTLLGYKVALCALDFRVRRGHRLKFGHPEAGRRGRRSGDGDRQRLCRPCAGPRRISDREFRTFHRRRLCAHRHCAVATIASRIRRRFEPPARLDDRRGHRRQYRPPRSRAVDSARGISL